MKSGIIGVLLAIVCCFMQQRVQAQELSAKDKAILQAVDEAIADTAKLRSILEPLGALQETNPLLDLGISLKLLVKARKENNKVDEANCLQAIGYAYRMMGQGVKGLECAIEALRVAETTTDTTTIMNCLHDLAHHYKDRDQFDKAIDMYKRVESTSVFRKDYEYQGLAMMNLGETYLNKGQLDSALSYCQRSYEIFLRTNYRTYMSAVLTHLGLTHSALHNDELAKTYLRMAREEAKILASPRYLSRSNAALALHFARNQQPDSAVVCAKLAIASVEHTAFSNLALKPAKLLGDIYRQTNSDSALKYITLYMVANDSLNNTRTLQETQALMFENELAAQDRQLQLAAEKEQRNMQIQFALIGLGILTFIILFLLLSRGVITNTRLISFLGVVALLLVFEFLNLLLHPFLERITHHNPILMLLALVCIAALLVPMHHRLEKWATAKLVEKNKQIRLAAAKRTLQELENAQQNSST
ncbi:MAG: tetratricopeptide repeat protein [Flavobacteriales bacterium]